VLILLYRSCAWEKTEVPYLSGIALCAVTSWDYVRRGWTSVRAVVATCYTQDPFEEEYCVTCTRVQCNL
jgi:hypothetical protein